MRKTLKGEQRQIFYKAPSREFNPEHRKDRIPTIMSPLQKNAGLYIIQSTCMLKSVGQEKETKKLDEKRPSRKPRTKKL